MSLYLWIAALFMILPTARAESESDLRPNGYAMPLSTGQCDCTIIQSKLDQQDQRVLEMINKQEKKMESKMDQQDHRTLEILKQQEKKMESIFNSLLTELDQLVEQRCILDKPKTGYVNQKALQPQDGGWGQWTPFSECSRSCGGGVQLSTRNCDSPPPASGGKYCTGMRMQYRSCNTEDCPEGTLDFREEQCHELDGNNFEIPGLEKNVKWIPKYGVKAEDQCKLYCRVKNSNKYFLLRDKVKDGTPCTHPHESYDMCINGQCRRAGCDYVFDSDAIMDKCGVCRGTNDTCSEVSGKFLFSKMTYSLKKPQKIVRIPRGATNIVIIQPGYKDDGNYIALRDENYEYIFNPPKSMVVSGFQKRLFAGVMLEYNGPDEAVETIRSDYGRPLKQDLLVEVISHSRMHPVSENIVEYSYTIPIDRPSVTVSKMPSHVQQNPSQNTILNHQWTMSDWSECDQSCSGKRHRTAGCIDIQTGKEKPISYCRNSAKPREDYEPCNTECKFEWEATSSECSNSCGEGINTVQYQCVQRYIETQQTNPVDLTYCSIIRKPSTLEEKCHGPCPDAIWSYNDWEPCSRTCGGGRQNRTVSCLSSPDGFRISDDFCAQQPREETYRRCNTDSCPEWVTGELTPCSVTCGKGQQRYAIHCVLNNVSVNVALCGIRPVAVIVNCTMPPCEKKQEFPTYAYSAYETRPIVAWQDIIYYSALHVHTSNPYKWCTSSWGICNAKCNGGFKRRTVQCCYKSNESTVDDRYCPADSKPSEQTNCGNFRCPVWNFDQLAYAYSADKTTPNVVRLGNNYYSAQQTPITFQNGSSEWCTGSWSTYNAKCNDPSR